VNDYGEEETVELGDMVNEYDSKSHVTDYSTHTFGNKTLKKKNKNNKSTIINNMVLRNHINWRCRSVVGVFFAIILIGMILSISWMSIMYPSSWAMFPYNQDTAWATLSNGKVVFEVLKDTSGHD